MRWNLFGLLTAVAFFTLTASAQFDPLVRTLEHGDVEQRRDALASVRGIRSEAASRIAVPALKDPNNLVRATAASSVVFLPRAEAAALLIPMLGDRDEFVRREAAYALGIVGDQSAVRPLLALLRSEKVIEVRSAAAIGLGGCGDVSAIAPLVAVLEKRPKEDEEFVRRSAARSIGQIAQFLRTGTRDVVTPQNFLPERFKDLKVPLAANQSATALQPATVRLLAVMNSSNESPDTRREAAFALGAIGDVSALSSLRSKSAATDPYLAEIAREAVAKIEAANPN